MSSNSYTKLMKVEDANLVNLTNACRQPSRSPLAVGWKAASEPALSIALGVEACAGLRRHV